MHLPVRQDLHLVSMRLQRILDFYLSGGRSVHRVACTVRFADGHHVIGEHKDRTRDSAAIRQRGGNDRGGWAESMLQAIDYKTGKIRWSHKWEGSGGRSGVLSTAGNLVFAGDPANNLVALNATTGEALWHANLGNGLSNGPISYELDGTQYLVVGAGDTMYGFAMLRK